VAGRRPGRRFPAASAAESLSTPTTARAGPAAPPSQGEHERRHRRLVDRLVAALGSCSQAFATGHEAIVQACILAFIRSAAGWGAEVPAQPPTAARM